MAGIYYELVKGGLGNEYSRRSEKISVKVHRNLEKKCMATTEHAADAKPGMFLKIFLWLRCVGSRYFVCE